jgi:hypothetical protein
MIKIYSKIERGHNKSLFFLQKFIAIRPENLVGRFKRESIARLHGL